MHEATIEQSLQTLLTYWDAEYADLVKKSKDCREQGLAAMADTYSTRAVQFKKCIQDLRQVTND